MMDQGPADVPQSLPESKPSIGGVKGTPDKQEDSDPWKTRPSIFGRIMSEETVPREIAWREFYARYVPIIRSFATSMGAGPNEAEDVVQDVLVGFFSVGSSFVYDPAKGRFRGYLKRATLNAIRSRARRNKLKLVALEGIDPEEPGTTIQAMEDAWEAEWERQMLSRALDRVRDAYKDSRTVRAFEEYVIKGIPAADVAITMQISRESVYQAKIRVTEMLRTTVEQLESEEP